MNQEKYTEKTIEALRTSQQIAAGKGHQELGALHLLAALLQDNEGLIPAILGKLNVDLRALKGDVERALAKIPRVSGGEGQIYAARDFCAVMQASEDAAKGMGD